MLLFINFFLLAITILALYYYVFRLRFELKRSDQLRKEAEKFQELFNTTWDGVFLTDQEGRFLSINPAGARVLGFENAEQLLDSKLYTKDLFVHPKERERYRKQILQDGYLQNCLLEVQRKDGESVFLELTADPQFTDDGEVSGFEGIFRDVTLRIRMEEELRNYSENLVKLVEEKSEEIISLERKKIHLESLAFLGQMVGTIVHEIRNPLSSIKIGLTALLKRTPLKQRDRRCLELATLEVTHLEHILRDLLNFAKPLEIQSISQNMNIVLDLALSRLAEDLKQAGISLNKEFASNLPLVKMDTGRFQQVFYNVLINAKEALHDGGTISVRTQSIPDKGMVRVEISDNGSGIRKDALKHIFKPFYSTKEKGTGLGLTVVQKIVEAHGGTVGIESRLKQGTKLWVELPFNGK